MIIQFYFKGKIFKKKFITYDDRTVIQKDCDLFKYREYALDTWKSPKYLIKHKELVRTMSVHEVKTSKEVRIQNVEPEIAFLRHIRNISPRILKRIVGNWTELPPDPREDIIQNRTKIIQSILKIPDPNIPLIDEKHKLTNSIF